MEIVKKAKISVNGKSEEVEVTIDTGADRTMIDEEVLLRLRAPSFGRAVLVTVGELKEKKLLYAAVVGIDGVEFGLTVIGGKKNLIGHDFLQMGKAVINEETGEVKLTKSYIEM